MSHPPMLDKFVTGKRAWRQATLREHDWLMPLPPQALDELRAAVEKLRRNPAATQELTPADFELEACAALMREVRNMLEEGAGFAVVDRLPMDELSADEAIALYWLLSSLIARPVAQKIDGTLIYDVQDTGMRPLPGSGVRPDKTNVEQNFHNDNSYSLVQPDHVGLLCVNQAPTGGESSVINVYTVHNEMLTRFPALLPRLYREFWIDRQKEHRPEEPPLLHVPMFSWDGRLKVRLGLHTVIGGYAVRGETMDADAVAAIGALRSIFREDGLTHRFTMERGQMQFVNNLETGHRRTAFVDGSDPTRRRRMVRIWMRDAGGRGYDG